MRLSLLFVLLLVPASILSQSLVSIETNGQRLIGGIGYSIPTERARLGLTLDGTSTLGSSPSYGVGFSVVALFEYFDVGGGFLLVPGDAIVRGTQTYHLNNFVARGRVGIGFSSKVHLEVSYFTRIETPLVVGFLFYL